MVLDRRNRILFNIMAILYQTMLEEIHIRVVQSLVSHCAVGLLHVFTATPAVVRVSTHNDGESLTHEPLLLTAFGASPFHGEIGMSYQICPASNPCCPLLFLLLLPRLRSSHRILESLCQANSIATYTQHALLLKHVCILAGRDGRFLHSKSSRARLRLANAIKFRGLLESHATLRTQTSKSISAFVSIQTTIIGAFCVSAHLQSMRAAPSDWTGFRLVDIGQLSLQDRSKRS
jgi:hypothetical protein